MATQAVSTVNGLDTAALAGLADALRGDAAAGRVVFRSQSRWQDGARVFTRISGYRIDGTLHHEEERQFVQLSDEPVELGATDTAPGPAEQLMHAIASCITATTNAYAALSGVRLTRLEVVLEGEIDLHGIFGLDAQVRPGFGELRATVHIAGDADEKTLCGIARQGIDFSPMRDSVERGVPVRPQIIVT